MSNENGTCDRCDKFAVVDAEELQLLREIQLFFDMYRNQTQSIPALLIEQYNCITNMENQLGR